MIARWLLAALAAALAVVGVHVILMAAVAVIAAVLMFLGWRIAETVARTGWGVVPGGG